MELNHVINNLLFLKDIFLVSLFIHLYVFFSYLMLVSTSKYILAQCSMLKTGVGTVMGYWFAFLKYYKFNI